jgi:hypothetical protein
VSEFISKCIGDVVHSVIIKTYPNQKPWIDGSIRAKLKARTIAFNHGKPTRTMTEYKQCNYTLCKAIKLENSQYRDKVVTIQRLIHDTYVVRSAVNHRLQKQNQPRHGHRRLAHNALSLTRPATKACWLSFSVANVSKTFQTC